jgi:hypothetical protein
MNPELVLAASLVTTFVAWYGCGLIPGPVARGLLRTTIIAVLCSPGIIIGHGFAVVPSLVALYLQPSVFTLGAMLVVWIVALGIVFGVPALRNHRGAWPPSSEDVFLSAHAPKFVFFGVIAALLMQALLESDHTSALWVQTLQYGLLFLGAVVNIALCYWATRLKQARPVLAPIYFAAPVFLVAGPVVPFLGYGGGLVGGLTATGRQRIAAWVALGVLALLSANALFRTYLAATTPPHVTIGGGVAGNAAMAAVFAGVGIVAWWTLRRHARGGSSTTTSG